MTILEFFNIGLAEIIMLFFLLIFFIAFICTIVIIGRIILKRKDDDFPISSHAVNVGASDDLTKKSATVSINVADLMEKQTSRVALPQQYEIKYVEVSKIIRCEADDNYTKFVLTDENVLVSRSLKEYADLLKPKGFMRTHQSHLVNAAFVKSWLKEDGGVLLLTNNEKIPISKPNKAAVKEMLGNNFIS